MSRRRGARFGEIEKSFTEVKRANRQQRDERNVGLRLEGITGSNEHRKQV